MVLSERFALGILVELLLRMQLAIGPSLPMAYQTFACGCWSGIPAQHKHEDQIEWSQSQLDSVGSAG